MEGPGTGDGLLSVRDLTVEFDTRQGTLRAVDGLDLDVGAGEVVGLVGESGCGKTVSMLSVLGLVAEPQGRVVAGSVAFQGRELLGLSRGELRRLRGDRMSMVFQDPMTSLNPVFTVGRQIVDVVRAHGRVPRGRARERAVELLGLVGVPDAASRVDDFPHQWSGGMRQRAMIAMAIANGPDLLIADEPTTALDVTIQAQVLDVLRVSRRETGAALLLITHDLGLVAELADRVVVMYAGRVVERGPVEAIFNRPAHPYTVGLLASRPRLEASPSELATIPGQPPSLVDVPAGCAFHPRCGLREGRPRCVEDRPGLARQATGDHRAACHFTDELPAYVRRIAERTGTDPTAPSSAAGARA